MKENYIEFMKDNLKIIPIDLSKGTKEKQDLKCLLCNEIFESVPADRKMKFKRNETQGCPVCARREARTNPDEMISKLTQKGYIVHGPYINNKTPIEIEMKDCCGRTWESRPDKLLHNNLHCTPCLNDKKTNNKERYIHDLCKKALLTVEDPNRSIYEKQSIRCNKCNKIFDAIPLNKLQKFNDHQIPGCDNCVRLHTNNSEFSTLVEYYNFIENKLKLKVTDKTKMVGEHQTLICMFCGKNLYVTPKSKMQHWKKREESGCGECIRTSLYKHSHENNEKKLIDLGYELLEPYQGRMVKILIRNNKCECGRSWKTAPSRIFSGRSFCKPCNDERKIEHLRELNQKKSEIADQQRSAYESYKSKVRRLTEANYLEHKEKINPSNIERGRVNEENDSFQLDHIISIQYCFQNGIPLESCAHPDNLQILRSKENIVKSTNPVGIVPQIMKDYISSYNLYIDFSRIINECFPNTFVPNIPLYAEDIAKYNLNFYSPEYNFGLVLLPLDDYKEQNLTGKHHLRKFCDLTNDLDVKTFFIFEDEWVNKRDIILSKITNRLGENLKRIHARKCTIKEIDHTESLRKFLNKTHVQGEDKSAIKLGAYYEDELVAAMTFSKPRIFMNQVKPDDDSIRLELSRFSTHDDYIIPGIASKLITFLKRNYDWDEIYSYADKRWSSKNSNVYEKMGFDFIHETKPNYFYIMNGTRIHRWKFRVDEIKRLFPDQYDPTKTEYENMLALGYDRIWDCGNIKYTIINNDK